MAIDVAKQREKEKDIYFCEVYPTDSDSRRLMYRITVLMSGHKLSSTNVIVDDGHLL